MPVVIQMYIECQDATGETKTIQKIGPTIFLKLFPTLMKLYYVNISERIYQPETTSTTAGGTERRSIKLAETT
jgi:hypothetical protein